MLKRGNAPMKRKWKDWEDKTLQGKVLTHDFLYDNFCNAVRR